jgi:exodeoxyribonuclease V beta subunit
MADAVKQFDPLAMPLAGVHSIAASAGTGKTYSIATLYLRYLLETDCTIDEVLVTTYTEAATAELKDRLRARLQEGDRILRRCDDPDAAQVLINQKQADATVVDVLDQAGAWDAQRRQQVKRRLETAILDFDRAPISTIHGFCNRVLQELVFETGSSFDIELVTSQSALIDEAVGDFVARHWAGEDMAMARWLTLDESMWGQMRQAASMASDNPACAVVPGHEDLETLLKSHLLDAYDASIKVLADLWAASGQEACALVITARDNGWLNGNKYGRAGQVDDAIAFIEELIASRSPTLFSFDASGKAKSVERRLAQNELIAGTKNDHQADAPRHAIFEQIESVIDAAYTLRQHQEQIRVRMLARLAMDTREHLRKRKDEAGILGFNDLLNGVDAALSGPRRQLLLDALHGTYRVAMVDEFQDTDPVQYRIFQQIFQESALANQDERIRAFVMIGDPKQSIYRFRGADIHSYLLAEEGTPADNRYSMGTNWRSDGSLVRGVQAVFASKDDPFLNEAIPLPEVEAKHGDRMQDGGAAFEVRLIPRSGLLPQDKTATADDAMNRLMRQAAIDIVQQLQSPPTLEDEDGGNRPTTPGDLAVLCRTSRQLRQIQSELAQRGVPAVLQTDESIFDSAEAEHVTLVLRALVEPARRTHTINALLTPIFGRSAEELASYQDGDEKLADWVRDIHTWHEVWQDRGFMVAWRRMLEAVKMTPRLAGQIMGERRITNYLHLGELLHREAVRSHAGPGQLLRWLEQSITDPAQRSDDETQLRLETDAAAVQLCTIHKSKGLEYPIVYCPALWHVYGGQADPFVLARLGADGKPLAIPELDLGSDASPTRLAWNATELEAEDRRLLYVALTRARHQCRVYWTAVKNAASSALGQIMIGDLKEKASDAELETRLHEWRDALPGEEVAIVTMTDASDPGLYQPTEADYGALQAKEIKQTPIKRYVQTSFTKLSGRIDPQAMTEAKDLDDAEASGTANPVSSDTGKAVPLAKMRGGRQLGDMVHKVFEDVLADGSVFGESEDAIRQKVSDRLDVHRTRVQMEDKWQAPLCDTLTQCITQKMSLDGAACAMSDFTANQLVCELHFVLRAGKAKSPMSPRHIADALSLSSRESVQSYAKRLATLPDHSMEGFIEGYIDLVFVHEGKWYLLDYKTNQLGPTWNDYGPLPIEHKMASADYILQYHLYCLALDRFLRQRIAGYAYETHFGGAVYQFVRGFDPASHPDCGLYFDRPDKAVIDALADVIQKEVTP